MIVNNERALATIRVVEELKDIPNADAIEAARVGGWWVVIKKGDLNVGDLALYIEIDAWVPTEIAPFLSKGKTPKVYEGVTGERLRTIRLRGQLSQGLLLPLDSVFFEPETLLEDGTDVTAILGIKKWERPTPAALRGQMKGYFPHFIRKTDQERIQNIPEVLENLDKLWEVSLKLDGSSTTVYAVDGHPGVCSRNLDLKLSAANNENAFVKTARDGWLIQALMCFYEESGRALALQAELMGPGVQGNREKEDQLQLYIFDIWDIDEQKYLRPYERDTIFQYLWSHYAADIQHVPTLSRYVSLRDLDIFSMEDILLLPEKLGASWFKYHTQPIEGLVFKAVHGSQSFKVINNTFLEDKNNA